MDGVFYKKLGWKEIAGAFIDASVLTSAILFIATSSAVANFIIAYENVPQFLAKVMENLPGGKIGFLILMDIIFILIGMVVDASPAIIIFAPIFLPIAANLGIDPTHFIVLMVTGLALGLTTPPYGVCLFSIASVCNLSMGKLVSKSIPFYIAMAVAFILVTFIPQLSLFLPNLLGL